VVGAAKRWPAEKYAELIGQLYQKLGDRVVLIEGPDEQGVAEEILRHCDAKGGYRPRVLPLRGPLGEAAAVLERAALYVGSDSGLAHLAAAVGTPAVTLFAPSDPERSCPWGFRHLVVQPRGRGCAPCLMYPYACTSPKIRCAPPLCIGDIAVEDVMAAVDRAGVV
jgi:ADP-heptose:LPS heptosyltransferase